MLSVYLAMVDSEDEKDLVEKLYNTYKKTLFNICLAILCNRPDAEDAVHETFIRIINNSGKIKYVDSPQTKAFCIIIARNVATDILREKQKTVPATDNELDAYESDSDNEETAISNISVERLKQALRALPKDSYDTLMLSVRFGCSLSEMSELLGISYQSVRYRLRKARKLLLKELEDTDEQP